MEHPTQKKRSQLSSLISATSPAISSTNPYQYVSKLLTFLWRSILRHGSRSIVISYPYLFLDEKSVLSYVADVYQLSSSLRLKRRFPSAFSSDISPSAFILSRVRYRAFDAKIGLSSMLSLFWTAYSVLFAVVHSVVAADIVFQQTFELAGTFLWCRSGFQVPTLSPFLNVS